MVEVVRVVTPRRLRCEKFARRLTKNKKDNGRATSVRGIGCAAREAEKESKVKWLWKFGRTFLPAA